MSFILSHRQLAAQAAATVVALAVVGAEAVAAADLEAATAGATAGMATTPVDRVVMEGTIPMQPGTAADHPAAEQAYNFCTFNKRLPHGSLLFSEEGHMSVTMVHIKVKLDCIDDFIDATHKNHQQSVLEKDNLRFDVLQSADDPQYFVLYEAYATDEAAKHHKTTQHYLTWRESVAPMMEEPREGTLFTLIAPST